MPTRVRGALPAERRVEDLRPFTVDHFAYWASLTTLDNGLPWDLEQFQAEILLDVFAGYQEILAVLPTGSGKTTMFGGVGLYHMQFTPGAAVPLGASSKPQATILYSQASGFITRSVFLQRRFKAQDGFKKIKGLGPLAGRVMEVYSSKDDTGDGIIPTLALIDELHRHKGSDLYGTWREKLSKRDGQMITLSTAGDRDDNPLEELRDKARKLDNITIEGRHSIARSAGKEFVMHDWSLLPTDDIYDLEVVKLANPMSSVTKEKLRMRRDSPSTKPYQWRRFTCNLQAKGEESAITPEDFDARAHEGLIIPRTVPVWLGLDLAWKIDHAAIAPVGWQSAKRRLIADVKTIAPPVEEERVVAVLLMFWERLNVQSIVYDPNAGGEQMVQQLIKGTHQLQTDNEARALYGLPKLTRSKTTPLIFVEQSQDNTPMALASARLDEAWRFGWIRHDGGNVCSTAGCKCGGFKGHVTNAVRHDFGSEKWKFDRPADAKGGKRTAYPIDGLTAVEFAHNQAVAIEGADSVPFDPDDYRIERV